jgi:hypothetical protein
VKLPLGFEHIRVWRADITDSGKTVIYLAFFNLDDKPRTINTTWKALGFPDKQVAHNVWNGKNLRKSNAIELALPAHGCAIYRIWWRTFGWFG